jgi:hypothetical protein
MLSHTLVFTRFPYHGPLSNPMVFYEINLFQKRLPIFVIMCQRKKFMFIGCDGRNLDKEHVWML